MNYTFTSCLAFGEFVYIDKDDSIKGIVTAVCWKDTGEYTVEVSWIHCGTSQSAWFSTSRLTKVEKQ